MPENIRPKFDFTITFGDLLMLFGFLSAIFFSWTNLDKRVVLLEEKAAVQTRIDSKQDANLDASITLMRQSQARIEDKLDRMIEKGASK